MDNGYCFIKFKQSRLGYKKSGSGTQLLLVFHGFGQDHTIFDTLINSLHGQFTIYSIDLFFHGKSEWSHGESPLSKPYWGELLNVFLEENKIDKFGIVAYSMGAKFAFATLVCCPDRVSGMYLMAPDGISTNNWYHLATSSAPFRSFFKSLVRNPKRFYNLVKLVQILGLADHRLLKFAMTQMDTEEKRNKVFLSWVVFRLLKVDMKTIAEIINSHSVKLWIFIGKKDKVITADKVKPLTNRVNNCQLKILDAGHAGIIRESIKELRNIQS